ncbi:MAG TPA: hypothetical protein VN873_10590 [Candidatus Angelobacter sp.]|nr:hypothetical protein [Candidatus Angelobacter sp.]
MNDLEQPKIAVEPRPAPHPPQFDIAKIASIFSWIKNFFDYLSASAEEPPPGAEFLASPWFLGLWWGVAIGLILLFCGQTSKFIYIDF